MRTLADSRRGLIGAAGDTVAGVEDAHVQDEELVDIDGALRQMCREQNLTWLVEAVDAAIREGFAESVNPGSSSYRQRDGSWSGGFTYEPAKRGRPQLEIRERDFTATERVMLLLDAMLAVYRDLPDLRAETIAVLSNGWEGRVPIPASVLFADDADSDSWAERADFALELDTDEDLARRRRVIDALIALRAEVLQ